MPYCYEWPRPGVAADVCCLSRAPDGQWHVLLITRANPPFKGAFALPGGFLDVNEEDLPTCARRELMEETGLAAPARMPLVGVYSDPARDPRGHVVSAVYLALYDWPPPAPRAGDDAATARWQPLAAARPLAFDHECVLGDALALAERLEADGARRG